MTKKQKRYNFLKEMESDIKLLFEQLNKLSEASPDKLEGEISRAAAIVQVSEAIIKSAEVENQFLNITSGFGSGFIPIGENDKKKLEDKGKFSYKPEGHLELTGK